jgi:hypothetical protein
MKLTARRLARVALPALLGLGIAAAPGSASTWTISGTIENETGSTTPCLAGAPSGWVGCITAGASALDDGSLKNGDTWGAPPAWHTPAGGGPTTSTFEFFAPLLDKGADQYTPLTMPDGSAYVMTAEDDVGAGWVSNPMVGVYAGCAEAEAQGSPFVCSTAWSGDQEDAQLTFTFSTSEEAPTVAAGQRCGAELGGPEGPSSVDCATAGEISPVRPPVGSACDGLCGTLVQVFNIGSSPVDVDTISADCALDSYADTCWLPVYGNSDIVLSAPDTSHQAWVGVEVLAVASGLYPGQTPNDVPSVSAVRASITSLRVAGAGVGVASPTARQAWAGRARPRVVYRTDRWANAVFRLARRTRDGQGRPQWARVGRNTVQTRATLLGRRSSGRCVTRGRRLIGDPCRRTFAVRGLFSDHTTGRRRETVRIPRGLRAGRYRLTARARAHGSVNVGPARTVVFDVGHR